MNKSNKKFLILSVFGIIFVVCGHVEGINNSIFLSSVFQFYSFHMALFAFISGYFFKDGKAKDYIWKKTKKLIIPYIIWNIIYGIIVNIFRKVGIIEYGKSFNLYNVFIAPFTTDSNQFNFNTPAWFLISIYFIQLIYFTINKLDRLLKQHVVKYIVFIVFTILASFEIIEVNNGNNYGIWYLVTRICFLMPFYALGQIYKEIERHDNVNNIVYFSIIIVIQAIIKQKCGNLVYNLNTLYFRHIYIVYVISSMTGILFWLRISTIIKKYIGNNNIINYIGNNTYSVMMHHVFSFFIINSFIGTLHKTIGIFNSFNTKAYKTTIWYEYNRNNAALSLIYVICGVSFPLILRYVLIDKYKLLSKIKVIKRFISKKYLHKDKVV